MQSAIDSFAPDTGPIASRSKWFWVGWGAVALSQLFAFWFLCNQQVRVAETRRAAVMLQQMALADCLQSMRGSAIATCRVRMQTAEQATTVIAPDAGAMSVSYTVR